MIPEIGYGALVVAFGLAIWGSGAAAFASMKTPSAASWADAIYYWVTAVWGAREGSMDGAWTR
jgi:hypothetical protein